MTNAPSPCPFCGSALRKMSEGLGWWHPVVGTCPLSDWHMEHSTYALDRWNARVDGGWPQSGDATDVHTVANTASVEVVELLSAKYGYERPDRAWSDIILILLPHLTRLCAQVREQGAPDES